MNAGRLRERVAIEAETRRSNGQGGWVTGWSTIARRVPAEIIALSGDEALRLGVERSSSQYRVTLRKRGGLTAKNRLQWNDQVMDIRSVQPHPKEPNSLLLLVCEIGFLG
jgi:SPP1 family predicted phage head-tail adaptor